MNKNKRNAPTVDLSDLLGDLPSDSTISAPAIAGDKLASFASEQIGPPEATILFWAHYTCACGAKFQGPLLDSPVLVRHTLLKHVCFGHYKPNGYIFRSANTAAQYLPAEMHIEYKEIPKCAECAHTALVPDGHKIEQREAREAQMHETARNTELVALERHRMELARADEADLRAFQRECAQRDAAESFQDHYPL